MLLQSETDESIKRARWITLDENIDLYANHEDIVEKVCFHRNAYCPFTNEADTFDLASGRKLKKRRSSRWGFFLGPDNAEVVDQSES